MRLRLLYELQSKITSASDFGKTPDGPRADVYLEGEVRGRINGKFRGVDYGLSRPSEKQGVVALHVHETIEAREGLVSVLRRGYAIPDNTRYRVKATCLFQTGSAKLDFLNFTIALAQGYADSKHVKLAVFEVM